MIRSRFSLIALTLGLLAGSLPGCGGSESPPEDPLRPVRFDTVYSTGAERVRSFSGVSQAGVESRLSFKVPGTVARVAVEVGDQVRAGDLIAELDPQDFRLQVQEAEASLTRARAEERNAQSTYDRVKALYENNNASRADLDAARTATESAAAQVDASGKRLEQLRLQLSYTRLTAPVAGGISDVLVEANENVGAGTPVAVLTSGGRPEVSLGMPEQLISRVREGQPVEVHFDAAADSSFAGRVTEVGVTARGALTTFPVIVTLEESAPQIRPGMAAEVRFRFDAQDGRERFLVAPFAVGQDAEGRFVYVVEETSPGRGVVHRRPVTTGALTDEGMEVLTGLEDGDRVVTAGVSRIHDGLEVKLPVAVGAGS